ncbi:MAG: LptF/LptG family permease [Bacteroidales bacterium]|nr:LptF/LptG family permease [Bacteroidales bacterium]MBN2757528.1 LptF/LptG family permease [Bacteroidales bacterium]
MLKSLHWLVLKSYIGPLVLTFFVSEFILIMQFLWLYIDDLVGKGLEWILIAELLLYAAAGLVQMALPLAILLASIMTFGDLGEHYELTAMKSAGISLQRIMIPLIILSVLISIGAFFFSNNVVPYTNLKSGSILYDVSHQRPELNIKPGIFNRDIEGYSIKIKSKNQNNPMMYDFMIYDHTEKRGNPKVTLADSGTMSVTDDQRYMIVTLYSGKTFEEMKEKRNQEKRYPDRKDDFSKQTIIFELKGFDLERTDETLFKHHYQMKDLFDLSYSVDSFKLELNSRRNIFVSGLKNSKYFKYGKRVVTDDVKAIKNPKDSIITEIKPENLIVLKNLDSIYNLLDKDAKRKILETAKETAISSRKSISSTQKDMYEREKNIYKHQAAWHEKLTLSFACFIFFFIGAPLGAIIRKGGFGMPFLVSILFFIIYYVISLMGKKFATEGVLPSWQGMWLSSAFTLPTGIFLLYKATTDSVLFDFNTYLEILKRPFKVLEIKTKDPSVIFYKDVEIPDYEIIINKLTSLQKESYLIEKDLSKYLKTLKDFVKYHFIKNNINLNHFVSDYENIYNILSVKYIGNPYIKLELEKLPLIESEKYMLNNKKLISNYLLISILIFPLGIIVFFRSFFKIKTLLLKLKLIKESSANILLNIKK